MALTIAALRSDTEADVWAGHDDPACNGCSCMAWRSPSGEDWGRTPPEINRRGRCDLLAAGERDGLILSEDCAAIGWCQVVRVGAVPARSRPIAGAARAEAR